MKNLYLRSWFFAVCTGLVVAILVSIAIKPPHKEHRGMLVSPPGSLKELVNGSDVIVLGRINGIVAEGTFAGYAADGTMISAVNAPIRPGGVQPGIVAYVDFSIAPVRLLKGHKLVGSNPIIMRSGGKRTSDSELYDDMVYPAVGDYRLFFLKLEPDGKTLAANPWEQIVMDGLYVTYLARHDMQPEFARNTSPQQFLELVLAADAAK